MINEYLRFIQESSKPDVLYHAASEFTKTLKPRKTALEPNDILMYATWASEIPVHAYGLERIRMLVPHKFTEDQIRNWPSTCWFKHLEDNVIMYYWNHIPTKPVYLYTVKSDDFQSTIIRKNITVWYTKKEITPLKIEKLDPRKIKNTAWKIATKKEYEEKLKKYRDKGGFK